MDGRLDRVRLALALALVSALRFLVPRRQRAVWLAEWRGELCFLSSPRRPESRRGASVLAHSLYALPHAAAHRKHEWSPEMFLQDLHYAVRRLLSAPGFTAVAVLTIAIGVGANTAIFSVIDSTLLHPMPYPDADRLVFLWKQAPGMDLLTTPQKEDVELWRAQATSFEQIHVYSSEQLTLTGGDEPQSVIGMRALPGFFAFLGEGVAVGREFSEQEAHEGARVTIISHALWRSHFGAAGDVLGRALMLDGEPYTVVGVLSRDFHFQAPFKDAPLWLPWSTAAAAEQSWGFAIARLAPGVSQEAANDELAAIAAGANDASGDEAWPGKARRPQDLYGDNFRSSLMLLQVSVGIILLIACANVANLLLARGAGQTSEMAVRAAIGAGRGRLFRQLLTEHILLALGGGLLGYGLARGAVAAITLLRPESMVGLATVRVDGWIFFFAMGVAGLTGLLFGTVPALQASRPDLSGPLRRARRAGSQHRGSSWLRGGLVVAEVALALLLLVGAGLLLGSLYRLVNADLGFDTHNVLSMTLTLPDDRYPEVAQRDEFRARLEARIRQVAGEGLQGIGIASGPLPTLGLWFGSFAAEGEDPVDAFTNVAVHAGSVSPDFFSTLGIALIDGRTFEAADVGSPESPVIINATWARRMWSDEKVAGRRFWTEGREGPSYHRVVGVMADAMLVGPTGAMGELQVMRPGSGFSSPTFFIHTEDDPLPLVGALKEQIWALDASLPIGNVALLDEVYTGALTSQRFNSTLLLAFAGIAVALALVGVYGVLSYSVGQRTHEIGIRMALGASARDVVPAVLWQGMRVVAIGIAAGIVAAVALTRFIESLLYEVSAIDPPIYVAMAAVLGGVAALACFVPALRAARLDVMVALRQQ